MLKDIKEGDIVTFSRYNMSLEGTVTAVNPKTRTIVVDYIHYVKLFQVIKVRHKTDFR